MRPLLDHASVARLDGLLRRMARNRAFEWVRRLAERDEAALAGPHLPEAELRAQLAPYWERYDAIDVGPNARGPAFFEFDPSTGVICQTILDPHDERQWVIEGTADMDASRAEGGLVAQIERVVDRGKRW